MHQTIQSNTAALAPQNAKFDFVARNQIVAIVDGEAVTTTGTIAHETGNEHASVIALVRKYQADFSEFGGVRFQIEPFETAGGMQSREIALMNEQQATLLLTYMRNTAIVREFKKRLVKEFWRLAKSVPAQPADLSKLEILQMALESEKARVLLTVQVEAQAKKIDHLENLFKEGMSHVQFCKGLNGVNVMQVNAFLWSKKLLYAEGKDGRPSTRWRVGSYARDKYMTEHQQTITPHGKEAFVSYTPILLRKGAVRLYELYLAGELPMKKNWDGLHTHDKAVRGAA
ncbi:Rha family transcriptional regulator [Pseudomonas plecoglossicida]|uniref:Rha family transcriptional regulator n=1 Tax=Pseudomonas TaxID=286 RepID=UPI000761ECC8|nr:MULTISPECIES: Rha family transcriptional regulator [Pseudomonas]MDQ7965161.1 Rha family transcriptional regulator [Pseudomonas plecoglossicida]WBM44609.1 Rha family transcriptional regulator [Pseudomonas putida]WFG01033.1 Rha family transcriptional regulator [Pseudomonas putida]